MRFVDEAKITVRSGKGGNGCASFRRERYIPKGGPDGGDGGKGGDVILRATRRLMTLYDFRLRRLYEAKNGQQGMGRDKYGRAADNLYIDLPVGTLVYEIDEDGNEKLVADLVKDEMEFRICQGGNGGRGNIHFKSSTNRAPRQFEFGKEGEERHLRLELKILADVGLLGLPNAGKSTFISAVSAARPKIAAYPFTTLTPNLGVVEGEFGAQIVIADIPGLIEGASEGLGLGHTFLKHVERTRFLVHILSAEDLADDIVDGDPFAGFALLDEELAKFDPRLKDRTQIRVINKIDLLDEEQLAQLRQRAQDEDMELYFMSALEGTCVDDIVDLMWERFKAMEAAGLELSEEGAEVEKEAEYDTTPEDIDEDGEEIGNEADTDEDNASSAEDQKADKAE